MKLAALRRFKRWLSPPALIALGVALLATGFEFSVLRPARQEALVLQGELAGARARQRLAGPTARQDPRLQLVRFYDSFPAPHNAPNWLEQIHAAAQANHLELLSGDYRLVREGDEQLARYQITLPLKGSYPNIRGFLNAMLSELPSVSLDQVAFERQKIGESAVQVNVRLTLYLRDTP